MSSRARAIPLVAALLAATVLVACGAEPQQSVTRRASGSLTDDQVAIATRVAQQESTKEQASISSATAVLRSRTTNQSNTGSPCKSSEVLRVQLIGDFPHIFTTGVPTRGDEPTPQDFTVHGVRLLADATTGTVCLISVQTGDVPSQDDATVLKAN